MSGEGYEEDGVTLHGVTQEEFKRWKASRSFTHFISEHYGDVAQESSTRLWYALANALAEKAIADFDRGDA
jgi:hypothetical protein